MINFDEMFIIQIYELIVFLDMCIICNFKLSFFFLQKMSFFKLSLTIILLICMSTWLGYTYLDIFFIFDFFFVKIA